MRVPLPLQFPADWPDLRVTQWTGASPAHKTGRAIDIELVWTGDKSIGSKYWYYYIETFLAFWAIQKRGVTRMAAPPQCPHFHIYDDSAVNRIGIEYVKKTSTGCRFISKAEISKTEYFGQIAFKQLFTSYGSSDIADYTHTFNYWFSELSAAVSTKKTVYVDTNGVIPEANLRSILSGVYAGSSWDIVKNEMALAVNYINSEEAYNDLKAKATGGFTGAALLALGYFLVKDMASGTSASSLL